MYRLHRWSNTLSYRWITTSEPWRVLLSIPTLVSRHHHVPDAWWGAIMIPTSASEILKRTLETVRLRANANGECFGGEIAEAMRQAGIAIGVDRLDVLLTQTVLARTMESLGENYPAEVLQDFETRMPLSKAIDYLNEAIAKTAGSQENPISVSGE